MVPGRWCRNSLTLDEQKLEHEIARVAVTEAAAAGPCPYPAGSLQKVAFIAARYEYGLPLWNAADCPNLVDSDEYMRRRLASSGHQRRRSMNGKSGK
jgi:hypothetical protein